MIQFLEDRSFLYDRVRLNIDVHPNELELEEFYRLATLISPHGDFSYRGCQQCVNYMVKFVFDNQLKLYEKE